MSQIEEQRLMSKIASLYYEEGLKQSEISTRLDLSQSFISRALRRALQEGVVKITVMRRRACTWNWKPGCKRCTAYAR